MTAVLTNMFQKHRILRQLTALAGSTVFPRLRPQGMSEVSARSAINFPSSDYHRRVLVESHSSFLVTSSRRLRDGKLSQERVPVLINRDPDAPLGLIEATGDLEVDQIWA